MTCSAPPMPPSDYSDRMSQEQLDKILNKFPLLYQELTVLFNLYKIISISRSKDLIFTIEFNDRVTNQKYKDKIIDYNRIK